MQAFVNFTFNLLTVGNQTLPASSHCTTHRRSSMENGLCHDSTAHTLGPPREKDLSGGCPGDSDNVGAVTWVFGFGSTPRFSVLAPFDSS